VDHDAAVAEGPGRAAGGLFAIARLTGAALRIPAGHGRQVLVLAATNIVGWNLLSIYGISHLPSGRAAILGDTMPVWATLLSIWLLDEPVTRRRLTGLALGMGGMALLIGAEFENLGGAPVGVVLMLVAAIFWAISRPMPLALPVIRTFLPAKLVIVLCLVVEDGHPKGMDVASL